MKIAEESRYDKLEFSDPDFPIRMASKSSSVFAYRTPMFHEELEIKLFYEGNATLMIDSDLISVQAGDIILVNPYELHNTVQMGAENGKYHLINMSLDFFVKQNPKGLDLRYLLLTKGICFQNLIRGDGELQEILFRAVKEMDDKPDSYRMMIHSLMTEFFLILLRRGTNAEKSGRLPPRDLRYYWQIEPALHMIRQNYDQRITLEELAEVCGMSKYHFCRIFFQCTNLTAMQCLMEYRLKVANHLLLHTNKNLTEIAQDCGFPDQGYFSRCYKKFYQISPLQHRKTAQVK